MISDHRSVTDPAVSEVKRRILEDLWETVLEHLCSDCQCEDDCEAGFEPDSPICARHAAYKVIDDQAETLAYNVVHPNVGILEDVA